MALIRSRSRPSEVFLRKAVLKICSKFTGEHPCQSAISVKLLIRENAITNIVERKEVQETSTNVLVITIRTNSNEELSSAITQFINRANIEMFCKQRFPR